MAGAPAPAADTHVALRAVASIDRLISESDDDRFLKEVLTSAAFVLRYTPEQESKNNFFLTERAPKYLH